MVLLQIVLRFVRIFFSSRSEASNGLLLFYRLMPFKGTYKPKYKHFEMDKRCLVLYSQQQQVN